MIGAMTLSRAYMGLIAHFLTFHCPLDKAVDDSDLSETPRTSRMLGSDTLFLSYRIPETALCPFQCLLA